jgi:DNA-binding NtrC family response regulator
MFQGDAMALSASSGPEVLMKRRILLVDDDVTVLLTLKAVLELNQFEVETAGSAAEAVKKLKSGVYEMVITDSRMETDDAGFHVIRAARQQSYNPATALLTAYPPRNVDWKHNGAQSLLVKPIGTQDLLRQIEALLVQHQDEKQSLERARPTQPDTVAEQQQERREKAG